MDDNVLLNNNIDKNQTMNKKNYPITLLKPGSLISRMDEKQSDLDKMIPIDYIMDWIDSQLNQTKNKKLTMSDRVIILLSKTGSGKSTSIAPNIYLRFFNKFKKTILITQPRILTTIEIPKDISMINTYKKPNDNGLSIELYKNLGWQTQEFVKKPKEKGILFTTTGILLQFLKTMDDDHFMKKYKFIILDEAHDRSLDIDLILYLMKNLIKRNLNKDPPFLIVMSATLDVIEYSKYFETKTIFEVSGQSKPIEVIYPELNVQNIYTHIIDIIKSIDHKEDIEVKKDKDIENMIKKNIRDIIIFMPSISYISKMIKILEDLNLTIDKKILPLSITSYDINQNTDNYKLLMSPSNLLKLPNGDKPYRRVIVSTNVAETGLTLETLRYCIDTGLVFNSEYNPRYDAYMLLTKPTTQSMSLQRKGRVGRKFPGVFYPLFTNDTFNNMITNNTPNILIENISSHILTMLSKSPDVSINKLPIDKLLTPPTDESITQSSELLFVLGAIDKYGYITKTGTMLNIFRKIPIQSRKMILSSIVYDISIKEMITLSCLLEIKKSDLIMSGSNIKPLTTAKLFIDLYKNETDCDYSNYSKFKSKLLIGCEFLELLLIYQRFIFQFNQNRDIKKLREWCLEKGLVFNTLMKLVENIEEILWQVMDQLKINPTQYDSDLYILLKKTNDQTKSDFINLICKYKECIYSGYKLNLLKWDEERLGYYNRFNIKVNVESKLVSELSYQKIGAPFKQNRPHLLIYNRLFLRKSQYDLYEWYADNISVMDGFVNIDPEFILT